MEYYTNTNKVAVLLSVYNGERYLPELLRSLGDQTYKDYTLYIRDDGSTDLSHMIIKEFMSSHPNVVLFNDHANLGSKKSFLLMLMAVNSDYYFFCDQDDVWLPKKIEITLEKLIKSEINSPSFPIIVHTDLCLVDERLSVIAESYWKYEGIPYGISHKYGLLCHFNDITGCAMAFNKLARKTVEPFASLLLPAYVHHDYLVGLCVAENNGLIIPINDITILFRRHGDNQTNPLINKPSILRRPYGLIDYIKEEYSRYLFYQNFRAVSFITFIINKILTKLLQIQWKKKHV